MNRAEGAGLGVALVGHAALLAALSLGLLNTVRPKPPVRETMDVMLVDKFALQSAMPKPAAEAPQAAQAPEIGLVKDAAPEPTPQPAPVPPKAASAPPPKPAPAPAKPTPPTPAPAKPTPAKPAPAKAAEKTPPATPKPDKGKAKALALGSDFLKGIPAEKSPGKGATPRAATVDAQAMAGLVALIASKVKPCYTVPAGGSDTQSIVSRVHLRLKRDGSIAAPPEVVGNAGVTPVNQPYVRQMNEAAVRAIQRCAAYDLPAELYTGGWEDLIFTFRPSAMN
jgi:outer membrane biosynthesis protein TonB